MPGVKRESAARGIKAEDRSSQSPSGEHLHPAGSTESVVGDWIGMGGFLPSSPGATASSNSSATQRSVRKPEDAAGIKMEQVQIKAEPDLGVEPELPRIPAAEDAMHHQPPEAEEWNPQTAVEAAQGFFRLRTNVNGGSKMFWDAREKLRAFLVEEPDDIRVRAFSLLALMDKGVVMKSPGTWRPHIAAILRVLAEPEDEIAAACKLFFVPRELVETAEAQALQDPVPLDHDGRFRKRAQAPSGKIAVEVDSRSCRSAEVRIALCPTPAAAGHRGTGGRGRGRGRGAAASTAAVSTAAAASPTDVAPIPSASSSASAPRGRGSRARGGGRGSGGEMAVAVPKAAAASERGNGASSGIEAEAAAPPPKRARHATAAPKPNQGLHRFFGRSRDPQQPEPVEEEDEDVDVDANFDAVDDEAAGADLPGNDGPGEEAKARATVRDPDGHYAILRQSPDSTLAQICAAYRQRLLEVHPDKGGTSKDFIAVRHAIEVLGDPDKRARYDGRDESQTGGTQAAAGADVGGVSGASGDGSAGDSTAGAKAAYASMLTTPKESWGNLIAGLSTEVVEALSGLLATATHRRQKVDKSCAAGDAAAAGADQGTGLKQLANGDFHVKVSWRRFSVSAGSAIRTLEQAANLHIALIRTRAAALARHKALLQSLKDSGVADPAADAELCPPLLESELLTVLRAEPTVNLLFASDMTSRINGDMMRIQSSWTPNLVSALDFRIMVRKVVLHRDGEKRKVVPTMQARAKRDREARSAVVKDAEREIEREKNRRRLQPAAEHETSSCLAIRGSGAAHALEMQPALPGPANASAVQLAQALVVVRSAAEREGAEVSRLRDELLHEQESRRCEFEDRRRAEEAHRLEREQTSENHRREVEEVRKAAVAAEAQRTDKVERDLEASRERHDRTVAKMLSDMNALTRKVLSSEQQKRDTEDEVSRLQAELSEVKRSRDHALQQVAAAQPRRAPIRMPREAPAPARVEAREDQFQAIMQVVHARNAAGRRQHEPHQNH
eukprot:gnl/TRDRNA2_/TRDRNA2_189257_c0_seq1.p1 gnl/TRDRNA2_/TRDRNA2_189257_c0~~gnl/TRDRNA2_/TRDRNA2_189257_c0_seq1.p1  ORF type:complete len:1014 (+),score=205.49 gnl/TRDRNA2_/TRDRNA2_189257_c0_seq1:80-3121(+)